MKKFILKCSLFASVVVIYIAVAQFFMFRIRENISVDRVVDNQLKSDVECYYNRSEFENVLSTYKLNALKKKQPEILVLGQSIVLCFRDFFFHPFEKDFYNTGLMIRNTHDIEYVNKMIDEGVIAKPKLIVLGIDHSLLMKNSVLDQKKWVEEPDADPVYDGKKQLRAMQEIIMKSDVREVPTLDYGYGKRGMTGNGYRRDGSCNNKWEIDNFIRDSIHGEGTLINDFKNHTGPYPDPIEFDMNKMNLLNTFLDEFKKKNIELLIYFPPLSDEFYNYASQNKKFMIFWKQYLAYQNDLKTKGYVTIPFQTPSSIGLSDYYMLNSDHPGEVMVATQFYSVRDANLSVLKNVDFSFLKNKLDAHKVPLSFMQDSLLYK